ncbi:MAG TPA: Gfo/Idh/MocA family oxidoreductase [Thermoguttaceae bacterium]|nr:Gfo/Idh/MocA family oxidoreductase [Thermoguttaceae bacterium]
MTTFNRREFLDRSKKTALGLAAGVTLLQNAGSVRGAPAADKVILAAVGVGGRGTDLAINPVRGFLARGDCEYAYICDPESSRSGSRVAAFAKMQGGKEPKVVADLRKALDDKSVDAIVSATPDHWHALSTVWACQAEKDVYVEKPAHHSCWEGQKMVEAARKYKRVVQVGTQNRSAPYNMAARKYIADGKLGTVHLCRIYNQKPPWGMTKKQPDGDPPAGFNWDIWNGPAPACPYNVGLHRTWNHVWRYSGGDIANDASHQIDLARWLLGVTYPKAVYCSGGRFAGNPEELVAETPDTQIALYDFDKLLVSFELTLYGNYMLKIDSEVRDTDMVPMWQHCATRIEIFGTEGLMMVGRHGGGWQVFDRPKSRQPVVKDQMYGRFPDPDHKANFIQCIRTREKPNADVLEGHRSGLMIHYANISYRLGGQKLKIDPATEQIVDNPEAMELFKRSYRAPYVIPEKV